MIARQLSGLQIVVLAAGFSRRLGRSKALTRIHGSSLLERTVSVLAQVTRQVVVVVIPPRATRLRSELRGCRVSLLANPRRCDGLSASVALGLRKCRYSSGTLFLPVDLAELSAKDIKRLILRWRGSRRRVAARAFAGRAAIPAILPKFLYPQARLLVGDIGLRSLLSELRKEQQALLELPSAVRDLDTPRDLADARRRALRHGGR
jgi:molybdenum cofactor cytidylyltransferase